MPGSKSQIAERGRIIISLARAYRAKHPSAQWRDCIKHAGAEYRKQYK